MNCDECLNLLEAYVDGEASRRETDLVRAHLAACAACTKEFETLIAENEMYARYDRDLQISPSVWSGIAARIAAEPIGVNAGEKRGLSDWFSGWFAMPAFRFAMPALAMVAIAIVVGLAFWGTRPQPTAPAATTEKLSPVAPKPIEISSTETQTPGSTATLPPKPTVRVAEHPDSMVAAKANSPRTAIQRAKQPDVLFTDAAYNDIDDRDTATHLAQAENLLVSFRNINPSDADQEVDVSYEKSESRRLLNENIVLRRDAESSGKYPMKSVLGNLEPYLIDIANLPDKATPQDVRQIQDRVQRREIVAELRSYE